jgi:hypothetical protein
MRLASGSAEVTTPDHGLLYAHSGYDLRLTDYEKSCRGSIDVRGWYRVQYLLRPITLSEGAEPGRRGLFTSQRGLDHLKRLPHITASKFGVSISWEMMAMDAEPPQRADRDGRDRRRARRAPWVAGAGIAGGLAVAIAFALGDISDRQAIMMGLPAAVLTFGGLTVAVASDPEAAERQGFRAGLTAGALRGRWRSVCSRRGNGRP